MLSERAQDGTWRYRDPRMQRVADALVGAELTQCAHRNRPLRHDGRVVVTLCADEVLYLPVTTEITSLPQLTPEGLPLALARRAAGAVRMDRTAADLEKRGEVVTARALAAAAHISLNTTCAWLRQRHTDPSEPGAMLSTLQYSTSDNTATIPFALAHPGASAGVGLPDEALEMAPTALESTPPVIALIHAGVCPAASHQLLWYWTADAWHCPLCDTTCLATPDVWRGHHEGKFP